MNNSLMQLFVGLLACYKSLFKPVWAVMPRILCTIVHATTQDPCATVCRPAGCVLGSDRHARWRPA